MIFLYETFVVYFFERQNNKTVVVGTTKVTVTPEKREFVTGLVIPSQTSIASAGDVDLEWSLDFVLSNLVCYRTSD